MKKKLILLTILFFLFIGFVIVRFFVLDKQKEVGVLQIISSPTASVFIDNAPVGSTPYESEVKVGDHAIKLIPQGEATETASWKKNITVGKRVRTYVNIELGSSDISTAGEIFTIEKMKKKADGGVGEISIETDPASAIVSLDNDEKGPAALLENVAHGNHELSIFLPGFFKRTQKINVESGYRVNAFFKLAIDKSQKTIVDVKEATSSAQKKDEIKGAKITINSTSTGFLRVRSEPTITASESARVTPGDEFDFLEEKDSWYKIEYEPGKQGWISSEYATKKEE